MTDALNRNVVMGSNAAYNQASIIDKRLETSQILQEIQEFLSGEQLLPQRDEETGDVKLVKVQTGEPMANARGVQQIMNILKGVINTAVVQGNFTNERYDTYIYQFHTDLAFIITANYPYWGILPDDKYPIINHIMAIVIPFVSRLIDNEERKSYSDTIRTVESNTVQNSGGISLNPFSGGGQK